MAQLPANNHRGAATIQTTAPTDNGVAKSEMQRIGNPAMMNDLRAWPEKFPDAIAARPDYSMIGKHILDGDIVVLEHGPDPRPGQIVAVLIDRKSTLKTFLVKNGRPFLKAENPKYPELIPSEELMIQGVFRALIRKARE
jgi:Peptidase S24-like